MQTHPEISFRCGPLALHQIKLLVDPKNPGNRLDSRLQIDPAGFLTVAGGGVIRISSGLNFQMAFREQDAAFMVPSVAHLKLDHYAAVIRQEGDRYLLQDPTFGNNVWVTTAALKPKPAATSSFHLASW